MINFKSLKWQNFLSTGNQFTTILLDKSKSTLIVGENGSGKSTILDALSFALYGKSFRNINKAQLINTITNKNCLVECEFSIGSKNYLIRRGQKPELFEVYLNGSLLNQNANVREYQEGLEKTILKMNQKSFGQIVVLGSTNFIPFMQLPPHIRREVIEDILDIQIFSIMNTLLKEKVSENKNDIIDSDHQINLLENKIAMVEKNIAALRTNNEELIKGKQDIVDTTVTKIEVSNKIIKEVSDSIANLRATISDEERVENKSKKILDLEGKLETKIRSLKKEIAFFQENDNCPTCKQGIEHDFKQDKIKSRTVQLNEVDDGLNKLEEDYNSLQLRISDISLVNVQITASNSNITENNNKISSWNETIRSLNSEIDNLRNNTKAIDENESEIEGFITDLGNKIKIKKQLLNHKQILDVSSVLLKDGGIKAKIIRQYIPIINKLVNKYLAAMDFFVQFELDDKFKEKIKSRFRDIFSYDSFSEGEKMRIDLSLLFTWRSIAKLRNSASTNLLIMDEVFDSSLDTNGTDEFLKILEGLTQDTNTFIISHKGSNLYDKFHSVIKFEKHKNFSRISETAF